MKKEVSSCNVAKYCKHKRPFGKRCVNKSNRRRAKLSLR